MIERGFERMHVRVRSQWKPSVPILQEAADFAIEVAAGCNACVGGDEMLDQIVKRAVEQIRKPCNDPLSGSLMDTAISRS